MLTMNASTVLATAIAVVIVGLLAYVGYKFFAYPPVWYDDIAPKNFNGDENE